MKQSKDFPKYYINNPSSLIETAVSSGGVEVIDKLNHTVQLSISPSQGNILTNNANSLLFIFTKQSRTDYYDRFNDPQIWKNFEKYLMQLNTKKTIYSRLCYAKKFYHLLYTENFNEVLQF